MRPTPRCPVFPSDMSKREIKLTDKLADELEVLSKAAEAEGRTSDALAYEKEAAELRTRARRARGQNRAAKDYRKSIR